MTGRQPRGLALGSAGAAPLLAASAVAAGLVPPRSQDGRAEAKERAVTVTGVGWPG